MSLFDKNVSDDPPAPGSYEVVLTDAGAFTSKKGDDWVKLQFRVVSEPELGHEWTALYGFKTSAQANVCRAQCEAVGVQVELIEDLTQLNESLREHVNEYFTVEVKQKDKYRNSWVVGGTDQPAELEPEPAASGGKRDSDIPF